MDDKDPQSFAVIGAAMAVHRELGKGFLESVYAEALACELTAQGIPFEREVDIQIRYKNEILKSTFRADFVCFGTLLLELKALSRLIAQAESQILHYLKATGLRKGLLLNFGSTSLQYKRFVL